MDVSGDVADVMVKMGIQLTEESVKMLAAGSRNLAAFLWALAKDSKKLTGKASMSRLLQEGKELKVFHVKEEHIKEFRSFAKKSVLFAGVKDTRRTDGMVDLITNVDFIDQVNLFLKHRGYPAPDQEPETPKKSAPRAPQENSSPERGSGSRPSRTATRTTTPERPKKPEKPKAAETSEKPSVKGRLAALRAASEGMRGQTPQRTHTAPPKIR